MKLDWFLISKTEYFKTIPNFYLIIYLFIYFVLKIFSELCQWNRTRKERSRVYAIATLTVVTNLNDSESRLSTNIRNDKLACVLHARTLFPNIASFHTALCYQ